MSTFATTFCANKLNQRCWATSSSTPWATSEHPSSNLMPLMSSCSMLPVKRTTRLQSLLLDLGTFFYKYKCQVRTMTRTCKRRRQLYAQPSAQTSVEYLAQLSTPRATDTRQPCGLPQPPPSAPYMLSTRNYKKSTRNCVLRKFKPSAWLC